MVTAPPPFGSCQQVRKEVHTKLPLTLFVRVNRVAVEFIRDVQHLCGQPCHALGTELQQHANAFLDATHAEAARKLEAIVEVEQWKQARPATAPTTSEPSALHAPASACDCPG